MLALIICETTAERPTFNTNTIMSVEPVEIQLNFVTLVQT